MTTNSSAASPEELLHRYEVMFGAVPELPAVRVPFAAEFAPDFQALVEDLRAHALGNGVLDPKIVQLVLYGLLVGSRPDAAAGHAAAARREGASYEELMAVTELAALVGALGALNVGGALLARLRDSESGAARDR